MQTITHLTAVLVAGVQATTVSVSVQPSDDAADDASRFAQLTRISPPPTLSERDRGVCRVPCELDVPRGPDEIEGETHVCGTLTVLMRWDDPTSPDLDLHWMVARATGDDPAPDPLTSLAGGPGQSSVRTALAAYQTVRRARNIVRIDQHGTGTSQRLGSRSTSCSRRSCSAPMER